MDLWSGLQDLFAGLPDSVESSPDADAVALAGDATPCKDFYNLGPMVDVSVSKARRALFRAAPVAAVPPAAVDPAAAPPAAGEKQLLESLVASLKQRTHELLGRLHALETEKQVAEGQVGALQRHNEAVVAENQFLNKTIDVLRRDLKRSRDRCEDLEGELTDSKIARDNALERAAVAEQQLADSDMSQARFMKHLADAGYELAFV